MSEEDQTLRRLLWAIAKPRGEGTRREVPEELRRRHAALRGLLNALGTAARAWGLPTDNERAWFVESDAQLPVDVEFRTALLCLKRTGEKELAIYQSLLGPGRNENARLNMRIARCAEAWELVTGKRPSKYVRLGEDKTLFAEWVRLVIADLAPDLAPALRSDPQRVYKALRAIEELRKPKRRAERGTGRKS